MATKEVKRQLLITAYADDGCVYGHGLPYSLPITKPVWVDMEYIQSAYALGITKIMVHNTETPMLLNADLYKKFVDMGYISPDAIEDYRIAAIMQQPTISNNAPNVRDIVTVEADLLNFDKEGYSTALVSIEMKEFGTNLEVYEPVNIIDGKLRVKFRVIAEGECTFKMQQVKMGENRIDRGTEYSVSLTAGPAIIAPTIDDFTFDKTTLKRDEIITVSGTISGDTSHPELLKVRVEGMDSVIYQSQDLKVSGNSFTMKFTAGKVGKTTLKLTQIGMGPLANEIGVSVSKEIVVQEKDQAPNMGKPEPSSAVKYVSEKLELVAPLSGRLTAPNLLQVEIRELGDKAQVSRQFAKVDGKSQASAELTMLKAGSLKVEIQQKGMGPDKDQEGTTYITDLVIKDKVAPIVGQFVFGKTTLNEEEVVIGSAALSGDLTFPELLQFSVEGADEHIIIEEQPAKKEGYNDVQMKIKGGTPGTGTLTIKQTGMGPNKDQEGEPQVVEFTILDSPEAPTMGQPNFGTTTITVGDEVTISIPLTGDKTHPEWLQANIAGYEEHFTLSQGLTPDGTAENATIKLLATAAGSPTVTIKQTGMGINRDEEGTEYSQAYTINAQTQAPTIGTFAFSPTTVNVGEEVTATAELSGDKSHPELLKVNVTGIDGKLEESQPLTPDEGNNNVSIKWRATAAGEATVVVKQIEMGVGHDEEGTPSQETITINELPEAPVAGTPSYTKTELQVGEEITVTFPLTGKKDHKELLEILTTGHESNFTISEELTVDAEVNNATIKLTATSAGSPSVTFKQTGMGTGQDTEGTPYTQVFTITPIPVAPTMGTMVFDPTTVEVGGTITGTAPITGDKTHPELFQVRVEGVGTVFSVTQDCQLSEDKNTATIVLTANEAGTETITVTQTGMGEGKDEEGTPSSQELTSNAIVAPTLGTPVLDAENYDIGSTITITMPVTGDTTHKDLCKVRVDGVTDKITASGEPAIEGNNLVIRYTAAVAGTENLSIVQIEMGPNKDQEGEPQSLAVIVNPAE